VHLKDGDFAISSKALGLNADSETATGKKKPTKNSVAEPNQASSALEIPDEITDEILGESPKNVEDDAMEDQEPKDGEDKALFDSDSDDDDDDDMNSEEADSEDDPNKLWCICQQPHNNRFMICCDSCLRCWEEVVRRGAGQRWWEEVPGRGGGKRCTWKLIIKSPLYF
jgi:hypothetical protein